MSFSDGTKTYDKFMDEYEGSMLCGCDHGCNQWIKKQEARLALGYRMMKNGSKNLDKMAQLPIAEVNKIWYWVQGNDSRRMNNKIRKYELYLYFLRCVEWELLIVDDMVDAANGDFKVAAEKLKEWYQANHPTFKPSYDYNETLGFYLKSYDIRGYKEYMALDEVGKAECQQAYDWWENYVKP